MKVPYIATFVALTISFSASAEDVRIYAASSMTNVLNDLITSYESSHDGIKVVPVYAGSSALARQIENGAPADVFVSANEKWVNYLINKEMINGDAVTEWASNKLVVIEPKGGDTNLVLESADSWIHALGPTRLAIGNTQAVPAGIYGRESLEALKVWPELEKHLAPTSNVRLALALVERKESNLGIVYKTDALLSDKVSIVREFDDSLHTPIRYPMAVFNQDAQTQAFVDYLNGEQGKAILDKYGFN